VTSGPILINVTVDKPKKTRAGVLLIGGENISRKIASTVFYDMNVQQVVPSSQPSVPRYLHTATRQTSGEVLVVGGVTEILQTGVIPQLTLVSELYEPASGSFKPTGNLTVARFLQTAVLSPDGKVLIVGGKDQHRVTVQTAEVYDPVSGTLTAAGMMSMQRRYVTAILTSGPGEPARVLVYGGSLVKGKVGSEASTEIWSEDTSSFSNLASLGRHSDRREINFSGDRRNFRRRYILRPSSRPPMSRSRRYHRPPSLARR